MDRLDIRDCYDKAVELLSRRPHFRRQLEDKLVARAFPPREIELCLERLAEQGLLDDQRTAREFVDGRLRRGAIGRRRMRFELAKRGAPEDVVDEALELAYSGSDLEATRSVAEAWLQRGGEDWRALARHLERKGFSTGSILTAVGDLRRQSREETGD